MLHQLHRLPRVEILVHGNDVKQTAVACLDQLMTKMSITIASFSAAGIRICPRKHTYYTE
jgi:hypothetical protein